MADRYISKQWLLDTISDYKKCGWNTDVCDPGTVQRVLEVMENVVSGAPEIGPRKYVNITLAAKNEAIKFEHHMMESYISDDRGKLRRAETVGNQLSMGFYKGKICAEESMLRWLEGMMKDG